MKEKTQIVWNAIVLVINIHGAMDSVGQLLFCIQTTKKKAADSM